MKELFAAFNTDFFRALTTLVIPGSVALSTWVIALVLKFEKLRNLITANHVESAFILFVAVILVGMIIEDLGARIESNLDDRADEKTNGKHFRDWYAYLRTAFVCEPIGRRYIRTLVTRLKFELDTAVGTLIAAVGMVVLWCWGYSSAGVMIAMLVVSVILICYLVLLEARATHRLLARARSEMVGAIRVVKP